MWTCIFLKYIQWRAMWLPNINVLSFDHLMYQLVLETVFYHSSKPWKIYQISNGYQIARRLLRNSKFTSHPLNFFSQPREGEDIFLYLRVSKSTMSVALVKEDKEIQCLVYFSSHTLHNVETRYLKVEKMALVLVNASRKLKLYV
jgi:hypothetical protein